MGATRRGRRPRVAPDGTPLGREDHGRSPYLDRNGMARGANGRLLRKLEPPSPGDRFGQLIVVGFRLGSAGGIKGVVVKCSCGADPHVVNISNLRGGRTTRCSTCAKRQSGHWIKSYFAYADIAPDDGHRRRLLNRISACINRCHNPNDSGYPNYGERGIHVHEPWRTDRRAFLQHLVTLDGWDNPKLELDREKVDRGYEPGNLRFVTREVNAGNRRKVRELQRRIAVLESCLRHCKCGAVKQVLRLDG